MITPKKATLPETWLALNPHLSISPAGQAMPVVDGISAGNNGGGQFDPSGLSERFWDEGYFFIDDLLPASVLIDLRRGIENLVSHGLLRR